MDIDPTLEGLYEILLSSVLVVVDVFMCEIIPFILGFLHVSLYQKGKSSLLGHVEVSEPTPVWNTLSICPTGLTINKTTEERLLSVMGNDNGLSFTVQIAEGATEIALDEPHTVNVHGDKVSMFQFIPPQGISSKQLDITATSESKVAAYLKVSQNCKEVDLQEDLESIDYKKESLRLSFATKGRITLSRVSIPPLTDSVSGWFIGIGLKNLSGDVKLSESKNVTLKLTRSFDYNYATPICVLVFVSFLVGILVSYIACFLFEESLTQAKPGEGDQFNNNADLKCLVYAMWEVIIYHWFSFDNCFYNDFCYRVKSDDFPFNSMISNLTFVVHGLILAFWVLKLEAKVKVRCKSGRDAGEAAAIKERYCFSIGYAYSWALGFQGLFSALYHLCPSRSTFQFDSAYMFIIAGLTVVLLYNGIEQNRSPSSGNVKYPVGASNFFLFFIVPLYIFNYLGVLFNSDSGLNKVIEGFFFVLLIVWWLGMVFWAYFKLDIRQKIRVGDCEDILNAFLFTLGGLLAPIGIFMSYWRSDLAQVFLLVCIVISVFAILAKAKLWKKLSKCKCKCSHCDHNSKCGCPDKDTFKVIFIFVTVIIWVAAVYVFTYLPTTNRTSTPENSRDGNEECFILGFFDWHDLWHLLSSFALLMGAFVVIFISSEPEPRTQAEIGKNNEPEGKRMV